MTQEQRSDMRFWRKAEKDFLNGSDAGSTGICSYLRLKHGQWVGDTCARRRRQLEFFRSTYSLWMTAIPTNRPRRAMLCGLIAAMIETGDI